MAVIHFVSKDSSNVDSVHYNDRTHVLSVTFVSGPTYDYANVPMKVAKGCLSAESTGVWFAENIKNKYKFTRRA